MGSYFIQAIEKRCAMAVIRSRRPHSEPPVESASATAGSFAARVSSEFRADFRGVVQEFQIVPDRFPGVVFARLRADSRSALQSLRRAASRAAALSPAIASRSPVGKI